VLWLEAFSLAVSTHLVSMQAAVLPLAIGVASFLVDIGASHDPRPSTPTHTHTRARAHTHTHTHPHTHACTRMHIHTHTHTYTQLLPVQSLPHSGASYTLIFGLGKHVPRMHSPLRAAGVGWTIACSAGVLFNAVGAWWSRGRELIFSDDDGHDDDDSYDDDHDDYHRERGRGANSSARHEKDSGNNSADSDDSHASESQPLLAKQRNSKVGQNGADPPPRSHSQHTPPPPPTTTTATTTPRRYQSQHSPPPSPSPTPSVMEFLCSRAKWKYFLGQLLPNLATVAVFQLQWSVIGLLAVSLGDAKLAAHNTMVSGHGLLCL
jgi:hypothetical protein